MEHEGKPTVKEYKKLGYTLTISVSYDRLECRCSYVPAPQKHAHADDMMTLDDLKGYLAQSIVRAGTLQDAVESFADKALAGEEQHDVLLASGIPPINGADGWLSYSVKASLESEHGTDDPDSIDFHNVQTFINVTPEEEIGRIIPPEPGVIGKTIVGAPIRPVPGKPLKLKIGKNIRAEEDGTLLIATSAGRLCIAAGEISVEEEYTVPGNVNFKVGSIVFNGVVNISGDVLDDFNVTATKGIKIGGNVGACNIQCDGDISLCGMDGQNRGTVICGGSLRAKFLHDCTIKCDGDIFVEVEVHNCIIQTHGKVIVSKGVVTGGSCITLGGIEVRKLGSPSSVKTRITAGIDYLDVKVLEQLYVELEKKNKQLSDAISVEKIEALRTARMEVSKQIMEIKSKMDDRANSKINVTGMLYENVVINLGNVTEEIKEQRKGPMSIIENTVVGGLRYLSMTGLNVKAADIEKAFVFEQTRRTSQTKP